MVLEVDVVVECDLIISQATEQTLHNRHRLSECPHTIGRWVVRVWETLLEFVGIWVVPAPRCRPTPTSREIPIRWVPIQAIPILASDRRSIGNAIC